MDDYFLEKIMNKDGCDIHYWVSGNKGPWLVFLHGAGADHEMFNDQLQVVSRKFKVLLWDARGHGLSRPMGTSFTIKLLVEDLIEILDRENIDKATFIGQSMGGHTVQQVAFYYPSRVEYLVLIGCACNTMILSKLERFYFNMTPYIIPLCPWKYLMHEIVKESSIKPEVQNYLRKTLKKIGKRDFNKIFLETVACYHYDQKYRINKCILLVYGETDNTGNIKKIAPTWAAKENSCDMVKIDNASHCCNQDNPLKFNEVLMKFLSDKYSI